MLTENQKRQMENIKFQQRLDEGALAWLQGGLDIVGFIPGAGEVADGVNAIISLARGNPLEAVLSAIAMIPAAGDVVGKGGKVILKVFKPAMELISKGADFAKIVKKIGPSKIKAIEPAIKAVKGFAAKHADTVASIFKHVKAKDLKALEEIMGIKIPKLLRKKAQAKLDEFADTVNEDAINGIFRFLAKIDLSDKIFGRGDEEEDEDIDDSDIHRATDVVQEAIKSKSLMVGMFGDDYINQKLIETGEEVRNILRS